jgi:hypothetical protein
MKNFLGGLASFIVGCFLSISLIHSQIPEFPPLVEFLSPIFLGSELLHPNYITTLELIGPFILLWLPIGLISGVSASSYWNSIRTVFWCIIFVVLFSLLSIFIQNPLLWTEDQALRNWSIILHFVGALVVIPITLPFAIPVVYVIRKIQAEVEQPKPEKIETICTCGAIFKSNPLICSECGSRLRDELSVP